MLVTWRLAIHAADSPDPSAQLDSYGDWAVQVVVLCALATVLAVPFVPPGIPILVAAVVAAAIGWFGYRSGPADEGMEPDIDPYPPTGSPASHTDDSGRTAAS